MSAFLRLIYLRNRELDRQSECPSAGSFYLPRSTLVGSWSEKPELEIKTRHSDWYAVRISVARVNLFWFGASSAIYDWVSWRPLGGRGYLYRWAETQKSFNLTCHHRNQDNTLGTSDTLKIWFYMVLMQFKSHSYLRKKTLVWNFKCFSAMFLNSVFNLLFHFHLCIEKDISQMTIETKPVVLK